MASKKAHIIELPYSSRQDQISTIFPQIICLTLFTVVTDDVYLQTIHQLRSIFRLGLNSEKYFYMLHRDIGIYFLCTWESAYFKYIFEKTKICTFLSIFISCHLLLCILVILIKTFILFLFLNDMGKQRLTPSLHFQLKNQNYITPREEKSQVHNEKYAKIHIFKHTSCVNWSDLILP